MLLVLAFAAVATAQMPEGNYDESGLSNATLVKLDVPYSDATGANLRVSLDRFTVSRMSNNHKRVLMPSAVLQGYLAYDNSSEEKRGLVVIFPDWYAGFSLSCFHDPGLLCTF